MVVIRRGKRSFIQRETLGWAQHYISNDLVGFPSHRKGLSMMALHLGISMVF